MHGHSGQSSHQEQRSIWSSAHKDVKFLLVLSTILLIIGFALMFEGLVLQSTPAAPQALRAQTSSQISKTDYNFLNVTAFLESRYASARVAILYTVFGEWTPEAEWEFQRLVNHVMRSEIMVNHDVVLLWEADERALLPIGAASPYNSPVMQALMASSTRVFIFEATAAEVIASKSYPSSTFHGFYDNPEVAAIEFMEQYTQYEYFWLLESDVRWTVSGCCLHSDTDGGRPHMS